MPGIAFAGDLHLSRAIYPGKLPQMVGDSEFALLQIANHCHENVLDLILLGDNFDNRFPIPQMVYRMVSSLVAAGGRIAFLVGQHDTHADTQWIELARLAGCDLVVLDECDECKTFGGNISVFGFDYTPRHELEDLLKGVPEDCEILCLHQLSADVMQIEDQWTLNMDWVPKHVSFTVMGDWHGLPQSGETNRRKWVYTGSSTVRAVGEPLNKSFVVVTRNEGTGALKFERVPLLTRPYIYNDLVWPKDLDAWLESIVPACDKARAKVAETIPTRVQPCGFPPEVQSPLVVCRYNVEIPSAYDRIYEKLAERISKQQLFLHLMPNRKFVAPTPDYVDEGGPTVSVQGAIDEAVDKDMAPVLHELVTDLAESPDPRGVITAFKTKHQVVDDPTAVLPL